MLKLYVQVETVTLQLFQIPPSRHASEHLVNIMSVKSILVHCNIIHSAYVLPRCRFWTKDTRSTIHFNLPTSNCRRHFNFVSVVNGPTRKALGFMWIGIDYTFSSSWPLAVCISSIK